MPCIALISSNSTIKSANKKISAFDTAPVKILLPQQTAKSRAYTITLSDVALSDKHDPAFTLDDNENMLVAKLTITNNSPTNQDLYPVNQIYIRTQDGLYYQMHPSMYVTEPMRAGQVSPGQTISGQVSFAIPKAVKQPFLYVDLAWEDYVPVVYNLLN